jgi:hypothetical protein
VSRAIEHILGDVETKLAGLVVVDGHWRSGASSGIADSPLPVT